MFSESDVLFVSYPKSGRTWIRMLVGKYIADMYGKPSGDILKLARNHSLGGVRRLYMTHANHSWVPETEWFDDILHAGNYKILLRRNPYEILASAYYHHKYRDIDTENHFTMQEFLESEYGVDNLLSFINETGKIRWDYKISYKDLHSDIKPILTNILYTMGLDIDQRRILDAIDFGQFMNLQNIERRGNLRISPKWVNRDDPNHLKFRQGKMNNFRKEFTQEQISYIHTKMKGTDWL